MQSDPALLAELAKGRLREKRALVAVGHSLLVTGYYMNTRQVDYEHLGAHYFDERNKEAVKRRAVKREAGGSIERLTDDIFKGGGTK